MILEEVIDCSIEKLESFSDQQLEEWFKPMFPLTRPELSTHKAVVKQREAIASAKKATISNDPRVLAAMKEASKLGIDLKGINDILKGL